MVMWVITNVAKMADIKLQPLQFPVAKIIETVPREQLINDIQQRQLVTRVYIDETMHHTN